MAHAAPALRPWSGLLSEDAWRRSSFVDTALEPGGVVLLGWDDDAASQNGDVEPPAVPTTAADLAFDPWCRLYRAIPEVGTVERLRWAAYDPLAPLADQAAIDLFAPQPAVDHGDFSSPSTEGDGAGPLDQPRGLAIDDHGRLFVGEHGSAGKSSRLLIFDLERRRLLRAVSVTALGGRSVDLTTDGTRVFALLVGVDGTPTLLVLDAARGPSAVALPSLPGVPSRVAIDRASGSLVVLTDAGSDTARVVCLGRFGELPGVVDPSDVLVVPEASDVVFTQPDVVVVARAPGSDLVRFKLRPGGRDRLAPLKARGYDGRGIAVTPDGRIVFWTARGPRHAVAARRRYRRLGRVISFRLDAGAFQTTWGRLFLDACVPRGTEVRVRCTAFDEPPEAPAMAHQPPVNSDGAAPPHADLTPPLPPALLHLDDATETPAVQRLHSRGPGRGRELPWSETGASERPERSERHGATVDFVTYEAPVLAPAGRYLWVVVELRGDGRSTPRIRQLRVERPGHDLLRRLPRAFAREPAAADYLQRYLASFEGFLAGLDNRAACRHALLDPQATPTELLPWLAGFLGMVLDERWSEAAKRTAIAEAVWLFRFRGTVPGLRRFLEIYLGRSVVVVEHFRMRGLGGAFVGGALQGEDALASQAVLGAGFRVGGALATESDPDIAVDALTQQPAPDGFATHAHRFTVVVPIALNGEQRQVVDHILEEHRPAHTLVQVCSVETGMRIGVGLYVALTTLVGTTGGFGRLRLGGSTLGRQALLGRAAAAGRAGSGRVGHDTRIG